MIEQNTDWISKKEDKDVLKSAGAKGEKILFDRLLNLSKTLKGVSLIPNSSVYVPEGQKKWAEIDLVMIHNSGVYVFENKRMTGVLSGKVNDRLWMKSADSIITFQNPIQQNKKHVSVLADYLGLSENLFKSVIVFSDNCDISGCPKISANFIICSLSELSETLKPFFAGEVFSDKQVEDIYLRVLRCATVKEKIVDEHLNYVNEIKKRKKEGKKR